MRCHDIKKILIGESRSDKKLPWKVVEIFAFTQRYNFELPMPELHTKAQSLTSIKKLWESFSKHYGFSIF